MAPYQERVIQEKLELDERRAKLLAFIFSTQFVALPAGERSRLNLQRSAMDDYSRILGERIAAFPAE